MLSSRHCLFSWTKKTTGPLPRPPHILDQPSSFIPNIDQPSSFLPSSLIVHPSSFIPNIRHNNHLRRFRFHLRRRLDHITTTPQLPPSLLQNCLCLRTDAIAFLYPSWKKNPCRPSGNPCRPLSRRSSDCAATPSLFGNGNRSALLCLEGAVCGTSRMWYLRHDQEHRRFRIWCNIIS